MTYTLQLSERETIININLADLQEGFFGIYTTIPQHARRIKKRAGKRIISLKEDRLKNGPVFSWNFKLPIAALSQTTFCLRSGDESSRAERTPEEIARAQKVAEMFKKARETKAKKGLVIGD